MNPPCCSRPAASMDDGPVSGIRSMCRMNRPVSKDAAVRVIAIVNQKGGCGKTTTAINLAALYAKRGLRTLLVDMDPQSHCAVGLGVPESRIEYSIGDALLADHSHGFDPTTLVWEVARNLDL